MRPDRGTVLADTKYQDAYLCTTMTPITNLADFTYENY